MTDATPLFPDVAGLGKADRAGWMDAYRSAFFTVGEDEMGIYVTLGEASKMTAVRYPTSVIPLRDQHQDLDFAWLIETTRHVIGIYQHPGEGCHLDAPASRTMPVTLPVQGVEEEQPRGEQRFLRATLLPDGTRQYLPIGHHDRQWLTMALVEDGENMANLPDRFSDAFTEPDLPLVPTSLDALAKPVMLPGGFARAQEVTLLVGPPPDLASMQTLMLTVAAHLLADDATVVWLDYKGTGPGRVVQTLQALDTKHDGLVYQRNPATVDRLALDACDVALVVVDGMAGLAAMAHVDERSARAVGGLFARLNLWAEQGAGVVVLDRPRSFRGGRSPFGSTVKIEMSNACWFVEAVEPVGPGRDGLLRLELVADKSGVFPAISEVGIDLSGPKPAIGWAES